MRGKGLTHKGRATLRVGDVDSGVSLTRFTIAIPVSLYLTARP